MTARYDEDQHDTAAQIQALHPRWLILWGAHSRRFWAYPRFGTSPGTVIAEKGTLELLTRMDHAEQDARLPRAPQPPPHLHISQQSRGGTVHA
jgi:hypothetical protein